MSAHVKVYRWRRRRQDRPWVARCEWRDCHGWPVIGASRHPTHAEALAAAWAHIKEHA